MRRVAACAVALAVLPVPPVLGAPSSAPTGNAPLRNTRWVVLAVDGSAVSSARGAPGSGAPSRDAQAARLVLQSGSQHLSGNTGCNTLQGRYTQRGTQLALTALAATRKACPAPAMQDEARLLEALRAIEAYRIEGQELSLLQGDRVRVKLKAAASVK